MARTGAGWEPHPGRFRARIKGYWINGDVCASREAAVKLKTVLTWAAVAFVLWWIIQQPASAAHLVHNIGSILTTAAHGLSSFIASL
jgi:hypothetical protein